jgi:hypothetical protein
MSQLAKNFKLNGNLKLVLITMPVVFVVNTFNVREIEYLERQDQAQIQKKHPLIITT